VEATLPHLPDVVADMVRVQRLTGMRPAELCMLRPRDLDRSSDVWLYRPASHKTQHHGRDRVIFIGPQAQAVLLRYLARDTDAYCFAPCDSEKKRRVPRGRGKSQRGFGARYDVATYRRAIHRACDKAFPHPEFPEGAKVHELTPAQRAELRKWQQSHRWSPNQLRHAMATETRREFGLEEAQVILGHARADVTQIYAERDLAKGVEVARRIG
jgi:integrase